MWHFPYWAGLKQTPWWQLRVKNCLLTGRNLEQNRTQHWAAICLDSQHCWVSFRNNDPIPSHHSARLHHVHASGQAVQHVFIVDGWIIDRQRLQNFYHQTFITAPLTAYQQQTYWIFVRHNENLSLWTDWCLVDWDPTSNLFLEGWEKKRGRDTNKEIKRWLKSGSRWRQESKLCLKQSGRGRRS